MLTLINLTNCSGTVQVGCGEVRYTRDGMLQRLTAFALASVLFGAPAATAVCQITCQTHSSHETGAMASHAGHHAHHVPDSVGASVTTGQHHCDHASATLVAVQQALQLLDAPALVPVRSFAVPRDTGVVAQREVADEHSPPGSHALIGQLRI
jgi:hypothetical protein